MNRNRTIMALTYTERKPRRILPPLNFDEEIKRCLESYGLIEYSKGIFISASPEDERDTIRDAVVNVPIGLFCHIEYFEIIRLESLESIAHKGFLHRRTDERPNQEANWDRMFNERDDENSGDLDEETQQRAGDPEDEDDLAA